MLKLSFFFYFVFHWAFVPSVFKAVTIATPGFPRSGKKVWNLKKSSRPGEGLEKVWNYCFFWQGLEKVWNFGFCKGMEKLSKPIIDSGRIEDMKVCVLKRPKLLLIYFVC